MASLEELQKMADKFNKEVERLIRKNSFCCENCKWWECDGSYKPDEEIMWGYCNFIDDGISEKVRIELDTDNSDGNIRLEIINPDIYVTTRNDFYCNEFGVKDEK